jgi:hypothetical protein
MKLKGFSTTGYVLFLIIINLVCVDKILGCMPPDELICQAYSRAESVFIGKAEKIEPYKSESLLSQITVTFLVEKTFKGKDEKIETANFIKSDCEVNFEVGKKYFVYKYESARMYNRTNLLSYLGSDQAYAESLSPNNPVFFIQGRFNDLSVDEIKGTLVTIEKGQNKYDPNFDKYGNFNFTATEKGMYQVRIMLPFNAQISIIRDIEPFLPKNMKVSKAAGQTVLEYEAEFKPNECDAYQFYIYKRNKSNSTGLTNDR